MEQLKRRVEKLEAAGSGNSYEDELRALAPRFGLSPEEMIQRAGPHKATLYPLTNNEGQLTIDKFVLLYELLKGKA